MLLKIKKAISDHLEMMEMMKEASSLHNSLETISQLMADRLRIGSRVWFCGNGGSAADAQHLAAELSGKFYFNRPPLPAEALHVNTSFLTAVANDFDYDTVYARALEAHATAGDILILLSTSGQSKNILDAEEKASNMGIETVSIIGDFDSPLLQSSDFILQIPSKDTPRIQEATLLLGHILCEQVESILFQSYKS